MAYAAVSHGARHGMPVHMPGHDVAYAVVKSLFDQFDNFRKLHPAFRFLNPEQMMQSTTLPLPIHPGAAKYFREVEYLLQPPIE